MAGNEWINGYLEAILDSGAAAGGGSGAGGGGGGGGGGDPRSPVAGASSTASPRGSHMNFNPTHYFVEEVVKGVDESDLHRTWIKVVATRNARERSTRLENMCWRIWHLARQKKQASPPPRALVFLPLLIEIRPSTYSTCSVWWSVTLAVPLFFLFSLGEMLSRVVQSA